MGQKVNPIGFRIGVYRSWDSRWFARKQTHPHAYAQSFLEDLTIRNYIEKNFPRAEIEHIEIEKTGDNVRVIVHSAAPGRMIGKRGQEIDALRRNLAALLKKTEVEVTVQEVKNPELSATVIAKSIADQLVNRASFKKVTKKAVASAMRAGAKGIKIRTAGRLGGAEIARDEFVRVGSMPLHTLRSDIDYGFAEAKTTYGIIGVKVWVCRGDYKIAPSK